MFCSKCGKEIADEALICPMCGCATANYHRPATTDTLYSQDYIAIKAFEDNVKSIYTTSIFSLVLFLGIGLLFSFIVWAKARSLIVPQVTTTNPSEIAMLASAKRKLKTALNFATFPMIGFVILTIALLYAGQGGAAIFVMAFSLLIMCLIGLPCTKHLNQELY